MFIVSKARSLSVSVPISPFTMLKLKAVCESYSTDALRHIGLLLEIVPSFISRGAAHTKRREIPLLAKEGTIPGI